MRWILSVIVLVIIYSCSSNIRNIRSVYNPKDSIPSFIKQDLSILKIHLSNGDLAVLNTWNIDEDKEVIKGSGDLYKPNGRKYSNFTNKQVKKQQ